MKGVIGSSVGPVHHMPAPCESSSSMTFMWPPPHAFINAVTPPTSECFVATRRAPEALMGEASMGQCRGCSFMLESTQNKLIRFKFNLAKRSTINVRVGRGEKRKEKRERKGEKFSCLPHRRIGRGSMVHASQQHCVTNDQ